MNTKLILGSALMLFAISCSNDDIGLSSNTNVDTYPTRFFFTNLYEFSDKETLKSIILDDNLQKSILTRSSFSKDFISLLDTVKANDPILSQFTNEEKKYIKDNNLTYYDLFNYEDFVPNLNFARLLNSRGEIQVKDSIYRITPYGTLSTDINNRVALDIAMHQLEIGTFENHITPNVKIRNSYNILSATGKEVPITRTSIENIPSSSFPSYTSESHTFVGKMLGKFLGDRSVKHHDFMKGYRIKGSLYDYDYGFYSEVGAFVASRKKRGGFFRKLNGWKGTKADELTIIYKGIVLELDLKIPQLQLPKSPIVLSENTTLNISALNNPIPCIDICGVEITDQQIMKLAGKGLEQGIKELKKIVNKNIQSDIKAVRFLTPNKIYIVVLDQQINDYNVEQIRKVFNSQVKFFISSSMINNPLSFKALADFMSGIKNLPIKRLKGGQVILAGKINGTWGGIKISKK